MKRTISAFILILLLVSCTSTTVVVPDYYAYKSAKQLLQPNTSTYQDVAKLYGDATDKNELPDGTLQYIWTYSKTVLKSNEDRTHSLQYDPALRQQQPQHSKTTYVSTLTAIFTREMLLKEYKIAYNQIDKSSLKN